MKHCRALIVLTILWCSFALPASLPAPRLNNNPQWDMVLTNPRPVLTFSLAGSDPTWIYELQIARDDRFRQAIASYTGIRAFNQHYAQRRVDADDALPDGRYYWRVRTRNPSGNISDWAVSRFTLDFTGSRTFSGYIRVPVKQVMASSGHNPANIIDWDDQGQRTFWHSAPLGADNKDNWIVLDMGRPTTVSRFWMLSTRSITPAPGWLVDFHWQRSDDLTHWRTIEDTHITGNDTYRNIIDFKPVTARFFRLVINRQNALQAQVNAIIPYACGQPLIPDVPDSRFVLLVGNQMDSFTYTRLKTFVESKGYKTVLIPHHAFSINVLRRLRYQPMAIMFSGNNADWQYLPMFEYYGEYEVMREIDHIPMMGMSAGNEFLAMAYGISFAVWLEGFDDTLFRIYQGKPVDKIDILPPFTSDPIFDRLPNPFQAVEIHSWAVSYAFIREYADFAVMARSSHIQAMRNLNRPVYSTQFHPAAVDTWNQAEPTLANFLELSSRWRE